MCIRNDLGEFIKAKTSFAQGRLRPPEAEAWALYQAIRWINDLGQHNVFENN